MAKGAKILLVEDSQGVREMFCMLLERAGFSVTAVDGVEEMKRELKGDPDLIILDLFLSGVDGRDICRDLKSRADSAHIPIVIVSAAFNVEESVLESGADAFVEKPFNIRTFLAKIDSLIQ